MIAGYDRILGTVRRNGIAEIDGVLVCQQVSGASSWCWARTRDPEMGLWSWPAAAASCSS